jgi:prevent-host-death family protein
MKSASVGEIQKNFARILRHIRTGEEITVTKRGKAIAKITAISKNKEIEWPDFYSEAVELKGKSIGKIITEEREERF